jgi:AraC-like DNA-binding protein
MPQGRPDPGAVPWARHPVLAGSDPAAVRDAVAGLAVGHDLLPGPGVRALHGIVNGVRVNRVGAVFVRYGAYLRVEAPATGDRLALTIPLGPMGVRVPGRAAAMRTAGFALDAERTTVMRPDPWRGAVVLSVDGPCLRDHLELLAGGPCRAPLRFLPDGPRAMSPAAVASTWRFVDEQMAGLPGGAAGALVRRALEELLLSSILLGFPHTASHELEAAGGAARAEPAALRRAREHIDAHFAEPLTVPALARAASLSVRGLQDGFRRHYGQSPTQALREVRLAHARRRLLAGGADETASRVAVASGFTHLGRFAAAYRERFGESPSATLREARAGPAGALRSRRPQA